jgi:hypothetical protein
MNDPVGCTSIAPGSATPGSISVPGEVDCYRVPVNVEDLTSTTLDVAEGGSLWASIWDPAGVKQCSLLMATVQTIDCSIPLSGFMTVVIEATQPVTATYEIQVV